MQCAVCEKICTSIHALTVHLRAHGLSSKTYYDTYVKQPGEGVCVVCSKPTKYNRWHYDPCCSRQCSVNRALQIRWSKGASKEFTPVSDSDRKNLKTTDCQICGRPYISFRQTSRHVSEVHRLNEQMYYDTYMKQSSDGVCLECGSATKFCGMIKESAYHKFCSFECRSKNILRKINSSPDNILRATMSLQKFMKSDEGRQFRRDAARRLHQNDDLHNRMMNPAFLKMMGRGGRGCKYYGSVKNERTLRYKSSYELRAFEILEGLETVVSYEYEPFSLKYRDPVGKVRRYTPDILVTYRDGSRLVIEVKPASMLYRYNNPIKLQTLSDHCAENGLLCEVWTEYRLWPEKYQRREIA